MKDKKETKYTNGRDGTLRLLAVIFIGALVFLLLLMAWLVADVF